MLFIIFIYLVGELKSHGLQVRKQWLMDDIEHKSIDGGPEVVNGNTVTQELKKATTMPKLSESINKLFGKSQIPKAVRQVAHTLQ